MKSSVCICKNCGRRFIYGDCQSPMLNDKRWNEIVKKLNLEEYEKEAEQKYEEHYRKAGFRMSKVEDEHLYLCYKCMEEGLGRKLRRSDLIGKNIPLNENFEYMYF